MSKSEKWQKRRHSLKCYTLLGGAATLVGQLLNAGLAVLRLILLPLHDLSSYCKIHSRQRDLDGYVGSGQGGITSANWDKKRAPFHSGNDSALYAWLKYNSIQL